MKTNSGVMLAELAVRARQQHGASIKAWMETANTLLEARKIAEHGDWLPWLKFVGIDRRTASNMVRLAELGLKWETVSHLGGVRAALDYAAKFDKIPPDPELEAMGLCAAYIKVTEDFLAQMEEDGIAGPQELFDVVAAEIGPGPAGFYMDIMQKWVRDADEYERTAGIAA